MIPPDIDPRWWWRSPERTQLEAWLRLGGTLVPEGVMARGNVVAPPFNLTVAKYRWSGDPIHVYGNQVLNRSPRLSARLVWEADLGLGDRPVWAVSSPTIAGLMADVRAAVLLHMDLAESVL